MLALTPVKLLSLGSSQRDFFRARSNAVPDFSDQPEAIFNAKGPRKNKLAF
jgi:hypothetical protein